MNPNSNDPGLDPDRLLGARLTDTTPAFEKRWTDLKRDLRAEPARSGNLVWLWRLLPAFAAMLVFIFILRPHSPTPADPSDKLQAAYAELIQLDAALRPMPRMEVETLDALINLPLQPPTHS